MADYVLVGADASGLELRALAHYLAKYDDGHYVKVVTEGDPHEENASVLGVSRDTAKTFMYAYLYGAGDAKLGKIVGKNRDAGRHLRGQFQGGTKGLDKLVTNVKRWHQEKGRVPLPCGYWSRTRSDHSALNSLLQGTGAIVMKMATVLFHEACEDAGLIKGYGPIGPEDYDYAQVHMSHDELQLEVKSPLAEEVGELVCDSIAQAGRVLNLRCPMGGEWKVGATWAETH